MFKEINLTPSHVSTSAPSLQPSAQLKAKYAITVKCYGIVPGILYCLVYISSTLYWLVYISGTLCLLTYISRCSINILRCCTLVICYIYVKGVFIVDR